MSTINNALSKLAEQQSSRPSASDQNVDETFVRAHIAPIKSSRIAWAVGGFTLSLGLGAWAVSSAPDPIQTSVMSQEEAPLVQPVVKTPILNTPSNTRKVVEPTHTKVYESPKQAEIHESATSKSVTTTVKSNTKKPTVATSSPASTRAQPSLKSASPSSAVASSQSKKQTMTLASVNTKSTASKPLEESSMQVHQVELTHRQMADKAIDRANKALESNDFSGATDEFKTALRYVPKDENTRRKLAALYYGNRQVRKSAELLEDGIRLNKNSTALRISLAGILLKEDQSEAALNTLGYIPDNVTTKYLAMRAALAQKLKKNEWALQSYQILSKRDPDNGRWWLGLGIQQERKADLAQAKESYTKALTMVGLSSQSQAFIRDRLAVLSSLEQGAE